MNLRLNTASQQLSMIGSCAREWLTGQYNSSRTNTTMSIASLLQILVGVWICEKALINDPATPKTQILAREVQRQLDFSGKEDETDSALLKCDSALVIQSAGILRALDCKSTNLERLLQELAATVSIHESQVQTVSPELFATHFMLSKLCLLPVPDRGAFDLSWMPQGPNLVQADETVIKTLATRCAAATVYGRERLSADSELVEQLSVVLPIWLLFYLRHYELEVGALLIRTMNYLHLQNNLIFLMSINFLLAQQQPDGRVGFFDTEVAKLQSIKPGSDGVLELYLPLTVACLWTIAEATNPDFTLLFTI